MKKKTCLFFAKKKTQPFRRGSKIGVGQKNIWTGPWAPPGGLGGPCALSGLMFRRGSFWDPFWGPLGGQKHSFYCSKTPILEILAFRPPEGLRSTPVRLFRPPWPLFWFSGRGQIFLGLSRAPRRGGPKVILGSFFGL